MKKTLIIYLAALQLATTVYGAETNTEKQTVKRRNSSVFNNANKPPMGNFLKRAMSGNGLKERAQSLPPQEKALNIITNAEIPFEKEEKNYPVEKELASILFIFNSDETTISHLKEKSAEQLDLETISLLQASYRKSTQQLKSIQKELKTLESKKSKNNKRNSFIPFQKEEL